MAQRQKAENRNARPTDRERTDGKSQSAMGQGADRSHTLPHKGRPRSQPKALFDARSHAATSSYQYFFKDTKGS